MDKYYVQATRSFEAQLMDWTPPGSIGDRWTLTNALIRPLKDWYNFSIPKGQLDHGPIEEQNMVDILYKTLSGEQNKDLDSRFYLVLKNVKALKPANMKDWFRYIHQEFEKEFSRRDDLIFEQECARELNERKRKRTGPTKDQQDQPQQAMSKNNRKFNDNNSTKAYRKSLCEGCGYTHENPGSGCPLAKHPGFNDKFATTTWAKSHPGCNYRKLRHKDHLILGSLPEGGDYKWKKELDQRLIEKVIFGSNKGKPKVGNKKP
jgi:rubrerythrin